MAFNLQNTVARFNIEKSSSENKDYAISLCSCYYPLSGKFHMFSLHILNPQSCAFTHRPKVMEKFGLCEEK